MVILVTPYVGVWIEILQAAAPSWLVPRHPLCGGVD